jgi:hypothetical protein
VITAALAWYDEPELNLVRMITSLEGVASNLIALDGRWRLQPGEGCNSPDEQAAIIDETCRASGIELALYRVEQTWGSQVAKRSALMHIARTIGRQPWTLVIDADEYVDSSDPAALHRALAHTERDVATVLGARRGKNIRPQQRPIRRIYRNSTAPDVRIAHNGYCTSDGRWLHGDSAYVNLEPAEDCSPWITVTNHINSRSAPRNRASHDYHGNRAEHRAEQWPRGLKNR